MLGSYWPEEAGGGLFLHGDAAEAETRAAEAELRAKEACTELETAQQCLADAGVAADRAAKAAASSAGLAAEQHQLELARLALEAAKAQAEHADLLQSHASAAQALRESLAAASLALDEQTGHSAVLSASLEVARESIQELEAVQVELQACAAAASEKIVMLEEAAEAATLAHDQETAAALSQAQAAQAESLNQLTSLQSQTDTEITSLRAEISRATASLGAEVSRAADSAAAALQGRVQAAADADAALASALEQHAAKAAASQAQVDAMTVRLAEAAGALRAKDELKEERSRHKAEMAATKSELQKLQLDSKTGSKGKELAQKEIETLKKQIVETQAKLKAALADRVAAVADKANLERAMKQSKSQALTLEKTLEKNTAVENKKRESILVTANKHKEVLSVHEERLRALSLDLQRTHMDLTACRGEAAGLEAQLTEATSGAAALKEENQRLEMELTQAQHCLECLQQEHTEACGQLNQAADQVKALLEAADLSTRDLTLLRGEHQQLQSGKELSDQHADRISAAHAALQALHAGVAESLAVLQGKSQELQVAHEASLVQLVFLQTSLKGSEDARASAEGRLPEICELQRLIASAHEELSDLQFAGDQEKASAATREAGLSTSLAEVRSALQVKEQEAGSLLLESRSAHARLAQSEQQLQDVSQVAATLQGQLGDAQAFKEAAEQQMGDDRIAREDLERQLSSQITSCELLQQQQLTAANVHADLRQQLLSATDSARASRCGLDAQLQQLAESEQALRSELSAQAQQRAETEQALRSELAAQAQQQAGSEQRLRTEIDAGAQQLSAVSESERGLRAGHDSDVLRLKAAAVTEAELRAALDAQRELQQQQASAAGDSHQQQASVASDLQQQLRVARDSITSLQASATVSGETTTALELRIASVQSRVAQEQSVCASLQASLQASEAALQQANAAAGAARADAAAAALTATLATAESNRALGETSPALARVLELESEASTLRRDLQSATDRAGAAAASATASATAAATAAAEGESSLEDERALVRERQALVEGQQVQIDQLGEELADMEFRWNVDRATQEALAVALQGELRSAMMQVWVRGAMMVELGLGGRASAAPVSASQALQGVQDAQATATAELTLQTHTLTQQLREADTELLKLQAAVAAGGEQQALLRQQLAQSADEASTLHGVADQLATQVEALSGQAESLSAQLSTQAGSFAAQLAAQAGLLLAAQTAADAIPLTRLGSAHDDASAGHGNASPDAGPQTLAEGIMPVAAAGTAHPAELLAAQHASLGEELLALEARLAASEARGAAGAAGLQGLLEAAERRCAEAVAGLAAVAGQAREEGGGLQADAALVAAEQRCSELVAQLAGMEEEMASVQAAGNRAKAEKAGSEKANARRMLELESAAVDVRDELEALQQSHAQLLGELETQRVALAAAHATAEPPGRQHVCELGDALLAEVELLKAEVARLGMSLQNALQAKQSMAAASEVEIRRLQGLLLQLQEGEASHLSSTHSQSAVSAAVQKEAEALKAALAQMQQTSAQRLRAAAEELALSRVTVGDLADRCESLQQQNSTVLQQHRSSAADASSLRSALADASALAKVSRRQGEGMHGRGSIVRGDHDRAEDHTDAYTRGLLPPATPVDDVIGVSVEELSSQLADARCSAEGSSAALAEVASSRDRDILELQRGMEWLQSELSHALQQRGAEAAAAQSSQTQEALAAQASQHRAAMEDLKRFADGACQAAEAQSRGLLTQEAALLAAVQDLTAARAADAAGHAVSLQEEQLMAEDKAAKTNARILSFESQIHWLGEQNQQLQQAVQDSRAAAAGEPPVLGGWSGREIATRDQARGHAHAAAQQEAADRPSSRQLAALEEAAALQQQRAATLEGELRKAKRAEMKLQALLYRLRKDVEGAPGGQLVAYDDLAERRGLEYDVDRLTSRLKRYEGEQATGQLKKHSDQGQQPSAMKAAGQSAQNKENAVGGR
ncbi:MAG: hypothetical protein WDW38_004331 [Sanguina aurantia]